GTTSRALALQARTLELYRQLGIAREVVDAGLVFSAANLWARGRRAAHIELGTLGVGKSPFPYGLIYPQDEHERFLIERLRELHVSIDESDFLAVFPLKKEGRARLIGTIRPEAGGEGKELGWGDVSKGILQRLRIDVRRVNWFSTYQVHHRVATRFRQGRVFL